MNGVFGGLTGPPAQMSSRIFASTANMMTADYTEPMASVPIATRSAAGSRITLRTGCSLSSITKTA